MVEAVDSVEDAVVDSAEASEEVSVEATAVDLTASPTEEAGAVHAVVDSAVVVVAVVDQEVFPWRRTATAKLKSTATIFQAEKPF